MATFISLTVALIAVFFGPAVAWAIARQQIAVTAREAWMREFREKVAVFLSSNAEFRAHVLRDTTSDPENQKCLAGIKDVMTPCYHVIRLLVAEKGGHPTFLQTMLRLVEEPHEATASLTRQFATEAEEILQCEREAITTEPSVWRGLRTSLGLDAKRRK
jgi:hypothetical protein